MYKIDSRIISLIQTLDNESFRRDYLEFRDYNSHFIEHKLPSPGDHVVSKRIKIRHFSLDFTSLEPDARLGIYFGLVRFNYTQK